MTADKPTSTGSDHMFTREMVEQAMHPDWPEGTRVVVYARKEHRESALTEITKRGWHPAQFVEVQEPIVSMMGEGRFLAALEDAIRVNKEINMEPLAVDMKKDYWKELTDF